MLLSPLLAALTPKNINQKQMEYAEEYAKETFCDLLEAWEELTGKKWDIEEE